MLITLCGSNVNVLVWCVLGNNCGLDRQVFVAPKLYEAFFGDKNSAAPVHDTVASTTTTQICQARGCACKKERILLYHNLLVCTVYCTPYAW